MSLKPLFSTMKIARDVTDRGTTGSSTGECVKVKHGKTPKPWTSRRWWSSARNGAIIIDVLVARRDNAVVGDRFRLLLFYAPVPGIVCICFVDAEKLAGNGSTNRDSKKLQAMIRGIRYTLYRRAHVQFSHERACTQPLKGYSNPFLSIFYSTLVNHRSSKREDRPPPGQKRDVVHT